jgi:hypothetical protein
VSHAALRALGLSLIFCVALSWGSSVYSGGIERTAEGDAIFQLHNIAALFPGVVELSHQVDCLGNRFPENIAETDHALQSDGDVVQRHYKHGSYFRWSSTHLKVKDPVVCGRIWQEIEQFVPWEGLSRNLVGATPFFDVVELIAVGLSAGRTIYRQPQIKIGIVSHRLSDVGHVQVQNNFEIIRQIDLDGGLRVVGNRQIGTYLLTGGFNGPQCSIGGCLGWTVGFLHFIQLARSDNSQYESESSDGGSNAVADGLKKGWMPFPELSPYELVLALGVALFVLSFIFLAVHGWTIVVLIFYLLAITAILLAPFLTSASVPIQTSMI